MHDISMDKQLLEAAAAVLENTDQLNEESSFYRLPGYVIKMNYTSSKEILIHCTIH